MSGFAGNRAVRTKQLQTRLTTGVMPIASGLAAALVGGVAAIVTLLAVHPEPAGVAAAVGAGLAVAALALKLRAGVVRGLLGAAVSAGAAWGLDRVVHGVLGAGYPGWAHVETGAAYVAGLAGAVVLLSAWDLLRPSSGSAPDAPPSDASESSSGSG